MCVGGLKQLGTAIRDVYVDSSCLFTVNWNWKSAPNKQTQRTHQSAKRPPRPIGLPFARIIVSAARCGAKVPRFGDGDCNCGSIVTLPCLAFAYESAVLATCPLTPLWLFRVFQAYAFIVFRLFCSDAAVDDSTFVVVLVSFTVYFFGFVQMFVLYSNKTQPVGSAVGWLTCRSLLSVVVASIRVQQLCAPFGAVACSQSEKSLLSALLLLLSGFASSLCVCSIHNLSAFGIHHALKSLIVLLIWFVGCCAQLWRASESLWCVILWVFVSQEQVCSPLKCLASKFYLYPYWSCCNHCGYCFVIGCWTHQWAVTGCSFMFWTHINPQPKHFQHLILSNFIHNEIIIEVRSVWLTCHVWDNHTFSQRDFVTLIALSKRFT